MSDMEEARARMIAKRFGGNAKGASTGGGGAPRRKKKAVHKNASTGVLFKNNNNMRCIVYWFQDIV